MRGLRILAMLLFMVLAAMGLRHVAQVLAHPYPVEYGEGVNLLWARRAGQGQPIYPEVTPDTLPHLHHPYPPLGPALVAMLDGAGVGSHPFLAGRLLSVLGMGLAAVSIFRLARARTSGSAAILAVMVFLCSPVALRFGPMMRIDPLPLGLSLLALVCVEGRRSSARFAAAGALAMAAFLAKPTYAAAAVVVAGVALSERKARPLLALKAGAVIPLLPVAVWLFTRESPSLVLHLWTLQNLPADPGGLLDWTGRFAGTHPFLLAALAGWWVGGPVEDRALRAYGALALVFCLLSGGVMGSQENYALEVLAIASLASVRMGVRLRREAPAVAYALLLAQGLLYIPFDPAPVFTRTYGQELAPGAGSSWRVTPADREMGEVLRAEIQATTGTIYSSDLGYLLAAGRDPVFQPYQFGRLARAGRWNLEALERAIAAGEFPLILLKGDAEQGQDPFLPPDLQRRIPEHAPLHRVVGPWHLYRTQALDSGGIHRAPDTARGGDPAAPALTEALPRDGTKGRIFPTY